MNYQIERLPTPFLPDLSIDDSRWQAANTLAIDKFHPKSSNHRPGTVVRLLHDSRTLYAQFVVTDRYVRCVHDTFQQLVSRDSCVEMFLQPRPDAGYFNFELNCGGTMLLYYIEDPTRAPPAFFRKYTVISADQAAVIRVRSTLPKRIEPELAGPIEWTLTCSFPFSFFETFVGPLDEISGQTWRGNFFKCGDDTSHPHWASWAPIGEELRFHQPQFFAPIRFA